MPLPPDQGPLLSPTYSTPSADNSRVSITTPAGEQTCSAHDSLQPPSRRYGPTASSDPVPPTASLLGANAGSRLSAASRVSGGSRLSTPRSISTQGTRASNSHNNDGWAWNGPEEDDYLHNPHPDPKRDRKVSCCHVARSLPSSSIAYHNSSTTAVDQSSRSEVSPILDV